MLVVTLVLRLARLGRRLTNAFCKTDMGEVASEAEMAIVVVEDKKMCRRTALLVDGSSQSIGRA